jgi:hypothetical protein
MSITARSTSFNLSEQDDNPQHQLQLMTQKSVSFFDIDIIHYYDSDDTDVVSSDSDDNPTPDCDDVEKHISTIIAATTDTISSPYFRVDLPYKIPEEYLEFLQASFNADLDFVGEFFADVYMYEVWARKPLDI